MNPFERAVVRVTHQTAYAPDWIHEPPDWTSGAVCASVDPELFFPEQGGSPSVAKRICAGCPVREVCLTWVMSVEAQGGKFGYRTGIYGGLSPRDRFRLADSDWQVGDPVPAVRLRRGGTTAGLCPHCSKPCRSVERHVMHVHPGLRGAA